MADVLDHLDFVLGQVELAEVDKRFYVLNLSQSVVSEVQNLQRRQLLQTLNLLKLIRGEEDLLQVDQPIKRPWRDLLNNIKRQVQNNEVTQMIEILQLGDLVVIELQFLELGVGFDTFDLLDEVLPQAEFLQK